MGKWSSQASIEGFGMEERLVVEIFNCNCWLIFKYDFFKIISVNGQNRRTQIVVQLLNPGLRARAKGSLPPEEMDQALDWLSEKVERQERSKLLQLEALFSALSR